MGSDHSRGSKNIILGKPCEVTLPRQSPRQGEFGELNSEAHTARVRLPCAQWPPISSSTIRFQNGEIVKLGKERRSSRCQAESQLSGQKAQLSMVACLQMAQEKDRLLQILISYIISYEGPQFLTRTVAQ
jgi:hypothetical protein